MTPREQPDWNAIRARLRSSRGQEYWRSLEELSDTPEFRELMQSEFPAGVTEWWDGLSRRNFLKLAAASLALAGLTACTKQPVQKILPYVTQPEEIIPGEPLFFASSMLLGGYATGVIVKSCEGHPVKVDGNPKHPSALGASSIWMQASILDLYDPDRSQAVAHDGDISTWALFLSAMSEMVSEHRSRKGKGFRILTETITSPTIAGLIQNVLTAFPEASWHQFDPLTRDNAVEGALLAFGEPFEAQYHLDRAAVIVSIEADFLYTHPERLRYTRQFTDGRRLSAEKKEMNRLYVLESTPTITGSMADHRLPLSSVESAEFLREIAQTLAGRPHRELVGNSEMLLRAVVQDLQTYKGSSLIIPGDVQPPWVHALAHLVNDQLGNVGKAVTYSRPAQANPVNQVQSFKKLVTDMQRGKVDSLLILGGNPAFTAPADFEFAESLKQVRRSIHLSTHFDETSIRSSWHVPQTHYLESWGDARSFDGTVSLMQPLIAPLYGGKSIAEILGLLLQLTPSRSDYELLRQHWQQTARWPDFESGWRKALHEGIVEHSAAPAESIQPRIPIDELLKTSPTAADDHLEICFRSDSNIWDGAFANNGWLQECPRPISKLTWDNAALVSPELAEQLHLASGDMLELAVDGRKLECPALISPGQAPRSVTLHLGYGRFRAGRVGSGVGFNAYALRRSDALWSQQGLTLRKLDQRHALVVTQTHQSLHSPERQIYRAVNLSDYHSDPELLKQQTDRPAEDHTLYEPKPYEYDGYKWAMSIDLNTCVGCNACLLACEAENNIPVVGKEEVARNREMFWIRIDTYLQGPLENPAFSHMPVPCMHCEHAPCELVCPTAATVHDHEGLNLQIYNRCIGTRFCSNNCPYKVRRFNFFQYAKYSATHLEPMYNPEVTVRWRGVMEKCTYCIQRISAARITAEKENRKIEEHEVRTACQQACPAEAIIFGDLNNPESRLSGLKKHPLDYSMLGELNTRPRTTYLAKVRNPASTAPHPKA